MTARAAVVVLAVAAVSCKAAGGPSSAGADVLWLPAEAVVQPDAAQPAMVVNGRSIYQDGTAAVSFVVDGDREVLVRRLMAHFAAGRWQQRRTQTSNPHVATSFESGFTPAGGGVLVPGVTRDAPTLRWHGEWQSHAGESVLYVLMAQGTRTRGYASYAPRPAAAGR